MKTPSFILTDTNLTIVISGKVATFCRGDGRFEKAVELLKQRKFDELPDLFDITAPLAEYTNGKVQIYEGYIVYNGERFNGKLAERILSFHKQGLPFEPYVRFLNNVMQNPNPQARQHAFDFIEANKIMITDDGCFLGYRGINNDYTSGNSNPDGTKNMNRVGDVVKMPREMCDADPNRTCSTGLHICGFNYKLYYNDMERVVVCKVNPRDVVAVPVDYDQAKMRVCRYEVIAEHVERQHDVISGELCIAKKKIILPYQMLRDSSGRFSKMHRDKFGRFAPKRLSRRLKKKLKQKH